MTDITSRKELMDEIVSRKNMGDKKFHSETSLQNFDNEEAVPPEVAEDPGVHNTSVTGTPVLNTITERRRTMSQPGPISGNLSTATIARTRRRAPRNVMYAPDIEKGSSVDRLNVLNGKDDYSFPPTPGSERNSPYLYNNNSRNGDIKSLNSYRLPINEMRGGTTPRKRSVATMDAQSLRSESHAPPPTSPEDNARLSLKYLTLILSCMYAVLLVTLGLIIYVSDPFVDMSPSLAYSITLLGVGFLFQFYLFFDINRYKAVALKNQKTKERHMEKFSEFFRKQEIEYGNDLGSPTIPNPGERTPESRPADLPSPVLVPLQHDYCFSHGRHSGSFYLKLGAAAFALGHLVHSVLLISVQVSYFYDDTIANDDCIDILQVTFDVLQPLYCFVQLFFIFKYCNVLILKNQGLAHFGFMHMIGSSLCFWIYNIIRETILALTIYANKTYGNRTETVTTDDDISAFLDVSGLYNEKCVGSQVITTILENLSPYLYPFGVEFNILIVGVYYIIWSNIGNCENVDATDGSSSFDDSQTICKIPTASEDNDYTSNIVIYADCHASNKGLFLGMVLTVVTVGILILGFVLGNIGDSNYRETGYAISNWAMLAMHTLMLIAVVIAYNQARKLDINEHPISLLDDILLFVCLPAFFMETVLSMVATINVLNIVRSIDFSVMVIQVLIQTPLIMDALRRCSNSRKLRKSKPGREVLMFLIIANVAMWMMYTFSYKSPESLDERYKYYGKVLWSILGHVSLPLIMFYRFHSSVCFADIWDAAYKPGSEH
ncbi:proton channel OtopLc-like [Colias croceus]|uniref:proton channel OtopLc-like n=1 Tax=Colias crocea TaxID=72248 RepID=UPI001E27B6BF|nr:proton channel OtopLc-like [Colias croceus]